MPQNARLGYTEQRVRDVQAHVSCCEFRFTVDRRGNVAVQGIHGYLLSSKLSRRRPFTSYILKSKNPSWIRTRQ